MRLPYSRQQVGDEWCGADHLLDLLGVRPTHGVGQADGLQGKVVRLRQALKDLDQAHDAVQRHVPLEIATKSRHDTAAPDRHVIVLEDLDPVRQHIDVFLDRLVDVAFAKRLTGCQAQISLDVELVGGECAQQAAIAPVVWPESGEGLPDRIATANGCERGLDASADVERARAEGATDVEIHDTVLIAAAFCSAVVGSITVFISEMRFAGKPPWAACSRIISSFGEM